MPVNLGDLLLGIKVDNTGLKKVRAELSKLESQSSKIKLGLDAGGAVKSSEQVKKLREQVTKLKGSSSKLGVENKALKKSYDALTKAANKGTTSQKKYGKATKGVGKQSGIADAALSKTAKTLQLVEGPLGGIASRFVTLKSIINANTLGMATFTIALAGFSTVLRSAASSFLKSEENLNKLQNTIVSTGRALETSSQQVDGFAQNLARDTLLGLSEARDGISQALTFDNIPTGQIERFGKIAADVAAGLNKDFKGTTTSIAKALQAPASALDGLGRAGVFFSKSQRKVLQDLVDTGKTAESTGIILGVLEKRFQGIAKARGASAALDSLALDMELFRESIFTTSGAGKALEEFINALGSSLQKLSGEQSLATSLGEVFAKILNALTSSIGFLSEHSEKLVGILKILGATFAIFRVKALVTGFSSLTKGFGATAKGGTKLAKVFRRVSKTSGTAQGAITALTFALKRNPFGLIALGLGAIATKLGLVDLAMDAAFGDKETVIEAVTRSVEDLVAATDKLNMGLELPTTQILLQSKMVQGAYSDIINQIAALEKAGDPEGAKKLTETLTKGLNKTGANLFFQDFNVQVDDYIAALKRADATEMPTTKLEKLRKEHRLTAQALSTIELVSNTEGGEERLTALRANLAKLKQEIAKIQSKPFDAIAASLEGVSKSDGVDALNDKLKRVTAALDEHAKTSKIDGISPSVESLKMLSAAERKLADLVKQAVLLEEQGKTTKLFEKLQRFNKDNTINEINADLKLAKSLLVSLQSGKKTIPGLDQAEAIERQKQAIEGLNKALLGGNEKPEVENPLADLMAEFEGRTELGIARALAKEISEIERLIATKDPFDPMRESLQALRDDMAKEGFKIANPLIAGINEGINNLASTAGDNLVDKLLGEDSKSFQEIAQDWIKGLLKDMLQVILFDKVAQDLKGAMGTIFDFGKAAKGPTSATEASGGSLESGGGLIGGALGLLGLGGKDEVQKVNIVKDETMGAVGALTGGGDSGIGAALGLGGGGNPLMDIGKKLLGFLPGFAKGGSIGANTAAIVGEKGPELFLPKSSGDIMTAGKTQQVMSNQTKNQNIVFNISTPDAASFKSARGRIESQMQNALLTQ